MSDEQLLSEAVVEAIQRGRKIEAIKRLREETGLGLREAKDAVEAYVRQHPPLATPIAPQGTSTVARLVVAGAIFAAAIALYRYFA